MTTEIIEIEDLEERRRREQLRFAQRLFKPEVLDNLGDDEYLRLVLKYAFDEYGVTRAEFIDALAIKSGGKRISFAAVSRWVSGKSIPRPYGRNTFVEVMGPIFSVKLGVNLSDIVAPSPKRDLTRAINIYADTSISRGP